MRCLLVSVRVQKEEKSGDNLMFLTLFKLPSVMKNGNLWYPKPSESVITSCVNQSKSPKDFEEFGKVNPGALCEVTFGYNEFSNKTFVAKVDLIVSPYSSTDLYK